MDNALEDVERDLRAESEETLLAEELSTSHSNDEELMNSIENNLSASLLGGTLPNNAILLAQSECSTWEWRLYEEIDILTKIKWRLAISLFVLLYLANVLFLNIASARFVVGERLPDLGFYYLPELSRDEWYIVDIPLFLTALVTLSLILRIAITSTRDLHEYQGPYIMNILARYLIVLATGHLMRASTYIPTTLPGASRYCLTREEVEKAKPAFLEVFFKPAVFEDSCGDLMFSGNMLHIITLTLTINKYGTEAWKIHDYDNLIVVSIASLLVLAEALLVIMARRHYTADVVVATYVTPLLWYSFNIYVIDRKPDQQNIAHYILSKKGLSFE